MELTDILICPRTGSRLRFSDGDSVVRVHDSDVAYPVVHGIVDFCPDVKDTVSKAYDACSSLYDAYMASAVSPGMFRRMFDRLVWGFSGDGGMTNELLSHLPSEFDGVLRDVPVGTGLFTCSWYAGFPSATIVAIDYSMGMLQAARMRFLEHGVNNVHKDRCGPRSSAEWRLRSPSRFLLSTLLATSPSVAKMDSLRHTSPRQKARPWRVVWELRSGCRPGVCQNPSRRGR